MWVTMLYNSKSNKNLLAAKVIATCLILCVSMQMCCSSAIPIWEYLTRNEKMSYLYSTFGQLVSTHCKAALTTAVNKCKRNILTYGYEKLQTFSEAQLDLLDPYQHGFSEFIWSSIMRDHPNSTLITTRKPLLTPPDSSIIIFTHQKLSTNVSSITSGASSISSDRLPQYPKNPLFDSDAEHKPKSKLAMDMDITDGHSKIALRPTQSIEITGDTPKPSQKSYLTGPLVIQVRQDGTPVEEDKHKPLPYDDDLEVFKLRSNSPGSGISSTSTSGRSKHRKIATISALKRQHLATLALQEVSQPPYGQSQANRQQQAVSRANSLTHPQQLLLW